MNVRYRKEILNVFSYFGMTSGRILSEHKSEYKKLYSTDHILFNANVFTLEEGKIWYGDINLTQEYNLLQSISEQLDRDIYILNELDGRYDNEFLPSSKIIEKAICKIKK